MHQDETTGGAQCTVNFPDVVFDLCSDTALQTFQVLVGAFVAAINCTMMLTLPLLALEGTNSKDTNAQFVL